MTVINLKTHLCTNCLFENNFTFNNQLFYWDDSGPSDETRVIVFTTEYNLRLLQTHRYWLGDGTFDLAPKRIFKQVNTLHILYNNKELPMVYALLPKKKTLRTEKLF